MKPVKTHRVLVLSTLWPNEAQPRFGSFVARSLEAVQAETHWDVTVINPIGLPPLRFGRYRALARAVRGGLENGIAVERPAFTLIPRIGAHRNPAAIVRAALPVARRLHAQAPFDLIDAQFFYPDGPAAMAIAAALGLPLSIKARGADIHYWGTRSHARAAMLIAADRAYGLLAVSEALAGDMAALGMDRDKITLNYTGIDRDRFRPLQHAGLRGKLAEELGIPLSRDEAVLATVGALIERKGQALVIEALAALPQARLLLIGSGPDEPRLRRLARDTGTAGRVHFLGSVDHDLLPLLLSAADAMVLPSASEGLANAWIEALACGTPLVITDVGGAREVLNSPEAGTIVPCTVEGVREGLSTALARPRDPQAVAATVAHFSWTANAAALASHYDALLARRSADS